MKTLDLLLIAVLLVLLAEVTYIITKLPRTTLKTKRRAVLVDTSVLMDGRITAVAKTGFLGDTLVIPRSVVGELQLLADNGDGDKRARARMGLDVVTELQAMPEVDIELLQDGTSAGEGVDNRLLSLAKEHNALIMTIDYNLNKVAHVEGVQVLNVNDLAQSIRMAHLPGERLMIELVQKGNDQHQAVGYLPDGTMVVIEQSSAHIGKTVEVEIIRSLQTSAGKMMFARRTPDGSKDKDQRAAVSQKQLTKTREGASRKQASTSVKQNGGHNKPASVDTTRIEPEKRPQESLEPQKSHNGEKRHDATPRPERAQYAQQPRKRTNSRRRSVDQEANLISLVDKQSD